MTQPVLCLSCPCSVEPKQTRDFFTGTHCPLLSNILHAWSPALILTLRHMFEWSWDTSGVYDELCSRNFSLNLGTYASCLKPIIWTIYKQKILGLNSRSVENEHIAQNVWIGREPRAVIAEHLQKSSGKTEFWVCWFFFTVNACNRGMLGQLLAFSLTKHSLKWISQLEIKDCFKYQKE